MSQHTMFAEPPVDLARQKKAKKATAVAAAGTFIEYYDFSVFGYVAATLAVVFFPGDDPTAALLSTLLVFAAAFAARPIGAIFFGWLGDRKGRRASLVASIGLMSAAAGLIAFLPGYAQIGIWAPILLTVLRMLQGFSAGGEIGGAASFIREWAPPNRRSLYVSFIPSVAVCGKAAAAGLAALAATLVPGDSMESWGWRIPFILAVPLGLWILWLRLRIEDTPEFVANAVNNEPPKAPFFSMLRDYPRPLLKVIVIALVQNIGTYTGTVFVAVYFSSFLGYTESEASTIVLIAVLAAAFFIPVAGLLGNRIGSKRLLIISYAVYIIITLPSFSLMNHGSVPLALLGLLLGMIPYALCQAGTYGALPEFFPVEVRHTGVAFGHSMGAVLGGAGSPYVATWLIDRTGDTMVPAYMLVLFGVVGMALVVFTVRGNTDSGSHLYR